MSADMLLVFFVYSQWGLKPAGLVALGCYVVGGLFSTVSR
jgi:uncharacterized integral membrane protein